MKLLGITIGKDDSQKGQSASQNSSSLLDIKKRGRQLLKITSRYQVTIIVLAIAGLLAITALRMLRYMDPPIDDSQVQLNLAKYEQTHIDPKVVQKIQQLQNSGTSVTPNIQSGRTNPFSE